MKHPQNLLGVQNRGSVTLNAKADVAELVIEGGIGDSFDGVTVSDVRDAIKAAGEKPIKLRLNSPGGDVFAGIAMHGLLKERGNVTAHVDGLAASAASVVAMAADKLTMGQGAFLMVHRAWGVTIGNAVDHSEMAATLDKIDGELVGIYASRTGLSETKIGAMLDAETWLTAKEAVDHGFAQEVAGKAAMAAFDLSAFKHVPDELRDIRPEPDRRAAEKALRDVGLSQRAAKAVLSEGWRATATTDDEAAAAEILARLQNITEKLK